MSRVQLALNVDDLSESIAFYTKLFGAGLAKLRPGYANFAVAEPPLKLVLLENPGQGGSLNHLGVEVADADTVDAEQARLAEAGLAVADQQDTTCCARTAPAAVGAYIGAAYFFTSSTSFANPAITVGRVFSATFAVIGGRVPRRAGHRRCTGRRRDQDAVPRAV